jgi:hypothetical protein
MKQKLTYLLARRWLTWANFQVVLGGKGRRRHANGKQQERFATAQTTTFPGRGRRKERCRGMRRTLDKEKDEGKEREDERD